MKKSMFVFFVAAAIIACFATSVMAASFMLNEYNAVDPNMYLKKEKSDTYFGRVLGNGGWWAEFVVTESDLDIRNWTIMTFLDGTPASTTVIANDDLYSSLAKGTIFTIAAEVPSAVMNSQWINYNDPNFVTGNNVCQIIVMDGNGDVVFGPAGEGISPTKGIGDDEVFKFEGAPSSRVLETDPRYTDGSTSTFGSPNIFTADGEQVVQDFSEVPEPGTFVALLTGLGGLVASRRRFTK